jgi:hypothetical protein
VSLAAWGARMLDGLKGPEGKGFGAIMLRVPEQTVSAAGARFTRPRSVVADMTAAASVRAMAHQVRHHRRHRAWARTWSMRIAAISYSTGSGHARAEGRDRTSAVLVHVTNDDDRAKIKRAISDALSDIVRWAHRRPGRTSATDGPLSVPQPGHGAESPQP